MTKYMKEKNGKRLVMHSGGENGTLLSGGIGKTGRLEKWKGSEDRKNYKELK
jgi:hypothetical protein